MIIAMLAVTGLPPQVRGAHPDRRVMCPSHGLTPAGAGSTNMRDLARGQSTAYPRRCGEHRVAKRL